MAGLPGVRPGATALTLVAALIHLAGCTRPAGERPATLTGPAEFTVRGRWPGAPQLTYRVEENGSPLAAGEFTGAIDRAAAAWTATGVVGLQPATGEAPADVTLGWKRGHHGACTPFGAGADVAHSGPVAPGTFVHFDLGRSWGTGPEQLSAFCVALHELGHVLGLGHSEAEAAVMGTATRRPEALTAHDLAGIHSLYGGGADGPGDLRIAGADGRRRATLRGVAPADACDYGVFDCDGDGRDEVLVWRTDRAGNGALIVHHFDAALRLERSFGPFLGLLGVGGVVGFATADDGDRLIVCTFAGGNRVVHRFDDDGLPLRPQTRPDDAALQRAANHTRGDLDGDGVDETVTR